MNYQGPGIYRHYKGGEYLVLGLGAEEATLIPVVIYRPKNKIMPADVKEKVGLMVHYWTRPLEDFNAKIVTAPDITEYTGPTAPIAVQVPRFTFVSGP